LHAAPTLGPPRQRRPPQIGPSAPAGSGQSALSSHGPASMLLHVSQRQCPPGSPVHLGLDADRVFTTSSVALLRSSGSWATSAPSIGGQSRLVAPKSGRPGTVALASHSSPTRRPLVHVPSCTSSFIDAS